jgi:hypothetical protein
MDNERKILSIEEFNKQVEEYENQAEYYYYNRYVNSETKKYDDMCENCDLDYPSCSKCLGC